MADIFDEINEDLRAERVQHLLKRYAALLVAAAILVVAAVVGLNYWHSRQREAIGTTAAQFLDTTRMVASPETPAATRATAATEFETLARTAPDGYRTLARLREAALHAGAGELPAALVLWDQVAADTTTDPLLRELASLMWVQHQIDAAEPALIEGRLAPLVARGGTWRPLALEVQALLALRTGQDGRARDILKELTMDPASPDGVRNRAAGLLSRMGEQPAASADPGTGVPATSPTGTGG